MAEANAVNLTLFISTVGLILGLMTLVWTRLVDGQKDQKKDVAEIYQRLLKESDARHAVELNLALNYPRTDTLRSTIDAAIEPLGLKVDHLSERVGDLREEFHEHRKEHSS